MIEISGLSKTYGGKQALDDVSFRAEQGKVTALIGPNGAGKSTLLHILLGLEPASSGAATFDGSRYNELGPSPCNIVGSFIDGLTPHPSRTGLSHLRWMDEPLNGLDPEGIQWVRDFIKDYVSDHRTVIVSSHYMAELELVTDHVVGLSNGRKVLDGDIAALLDQYGSLEQAYFNVVKK